MIIVLQVAGAIALLAGLVAIGVGIPVKEFSFGNTMILAGVVGVCTGLMLFGLSVVASEVRALARRLVAPRPAAEPRAARAALPPFPAATPAPAATGEGGLPFSRDNPPPPPPAGGAEPAVPSRQEEGARARGDAPIDPGPVPSASSPAKPRRNLLFSSTVRKDREGATPAPPELRPAPLSSPPPAEGGEPPPASFEDAWPKSGRARPSDVPPPRRPSRVAPPVMPAEPAADSAAPPDRPAPAPAERPASPPPAEPVPGVTVLKSGVVDGMAYSLYSDGSIEAQMPEGMMRFASIDELRAHLDQRP